jgi:hypothetical protein
MGRRAPLAVTFSPETGPGEMIAWPVANIVSPGRRWKIEGAAQTPGRGLCNPDDDGHYAYARIRKAAPDVWVDQGAFLTVQPECA